ncbi:phosphotransferase family protein [Aspergillus varians]
MAAIYEEDLFKYTSGRWLIDEAHQFQQRYVKFNIDTLCQQAISLFKNAEKCTRVIKIEGNSNKAFLLALDDGREVVAKIPCPNAGILSLTTVSEVATLEFLRSNTSIRVPEVFSWSSDPTNPVGAEYIIMEKISGVPLAERWDKMNTLQQYKVIDGLIEMEEELARLTFPAYGSLFLKDSLPTGYQSYALASEVDPAGSFCVGPSCDRSLWDESNSDEPTTADIGPWQSLSEFAQSSPARELSRIADQKDAVQRHLNRFSASQSTNQYSNLLHNLQAALTTLSKDQRILDVAQPVLWHSDLHLGNIFVSIDDPTIIEGIIDWQSASISPLFLQAQFPEFVRPPKGYTPGAAVPALPDNFDQLTPEQKEKASREKELASRSKYYEMFCLVHNKSVYNALELDRRLWELFTCSALSDRGSLVPLQDALACVSRDWETIGLPGSCPFGFTEDVLSMHKEDVAKYQDMVSLWGIVKEQLGTDSTGWVSHERWEVTNEINQELFDMYVETMSEEISPNAAAKMWPFPPRAQRGD